MELLDKDTYLLRYEAAREADDEAIMDQVRRSFPKSIAVFESTWMIRTSQRPKEILEPLRQFLKPTDALMVVPLAGEGAWLGLSRRTSAWLTRYMKRTSPTPEP